MTFPDLAVFALLFICGSFGIIATCRPAQGRLFWWCALVCCLFLAAVLVLEVVQSPGV